MSTEEKFPPLVIRLLGNTESNWIMEGTEKDREPLRMSWPSLLRICPTSKVREALPEGGFRYVSIRHIAGCEFLDPARQDKEGWKVNLEQDNIWVFNGSATFLREGSTIGTYDYLKKYQGNFNNPDRPLEADIEFEEVVSSDIARVVNLSFDLKADAYQILAEVRRRDGEAFIYDEEKLSLLSTLFDLNHLDTNDEKFQELFLVAETRPALIVDSIANGKRKLFAQIKKAEELAVLGFSADRAYFTRSNTPILVFKGKVAKNSQVNRLADYLLTEEGKVFLQQLTAEIDTVALKSLETVS